MDWVVLNVSSTPPYAVVDVNLTSLPQLSLLQWNQPSIDFYRHKLGAKPMDEWTGMRLEEDGIERLKNLK